MLGLCICFTQVIKFWKCYIGILWNEFSIGIELIDLLKKTWSILLKLIVARAEFILKLLYIIDSLLKGLMFHIDWRFELFHQFEIRLHILDCHIILCNKHLTIREISLQLEWSNQFIALLTKKFCFTLQRSRIHHLWHTLEEFIHLVELLLTLLILEFFPLGKITDFCNFLIYIPHIIKTIYIWISKFMCISFSLRHLILQCYLYGVLKSLLISEDASASIRIFTQLIFQ